jgi:hypothetical protein
MAVPRTINWHAWINVMPGPPSRLYVTGEVETGAGNMLPRLTETVPQGINPTVLLLDLTIVQEGDLGIDLVAYRPARFEKPVQPGQYSQVEIRFEGEIVATVDVKTVQ